MPTQIKHKVILEVKQLKIMQQWWMHKSLANCLFNCKCTEIGIRFFHFERGIIHGYLPLRWVLSLNSPLNIKMIFCENIISSWRKMP
jgi:hypothetical protein